MALLNARGERIETGLSRGIRGKLARLDTQGPFRDPEWDRQLQLLAPDSPHLTTLRLVWVAGDPWQPIERWVVYQMYPVGVVPTLVSEEELKGPDPRTYAGDWDTVLERFVRVKELTIDRMQWRLYQETGRYGFPYWVVQGQGGGHLRRFTPVQRAISKLEGGWEDPPAPGDLPYAAPNQKTWDGLREMDLLKDYDGLLAFHLRAPAMIQGEEREKAERMRKRMWNQLKGQQEGLWADEKGVIRRIREALPHGTGRGGSTVDEEAVERRFVTED